MKPGQTGDHQATNAGEVCQNGQNRLETSPPSRSALTRAGETGIAPGLVLSRYQVERQLGRSGLAEVFLGEDMQSHRRVVIKALPVRGMHDPDWFLRFRKEADIASRLDHPNTIKILSFAQTESGQPFFVMDHLRGGTLAEKLRAGALRWDEAVRIVSDVLLGLAHAHGRGVVHQAIRPENILLSESGTAVITNFGLARTGTEAGWAGTGGAGLEIPYYLSPEQCQELDVDSRSDLYSLGVVFYQMLTGTLPFGGKYDQAVLDAHVNKKPDPPRARRADIPQQLQPIVLKALAKARKDRFATATEFLIALEAMDVKKAAGKKDPSPISAGLISNKGNPTTASSEESPDSDQPVPLLTDRELEFNPELDLLKSLLASLKWVFRKIFRS